MRGIVCEFSSYTELQHALHHGRDEQELDLPCCEAVRDGEWLVVTITVGDESTTVAGRVEERGSGLRLTFEARDWCRLSGFVEDGGPPSFRPNERPSIPHPVSAAPGTRVLVVDDDSAVQTIVTTMLEASGMSALQAGSAEEAWSCLNDGGVDLIVLDWSLPGMTGIDLCKRLRADCRLAPVPVLFLTAHSSSEDLVAAFQAGADDFVSKPFRAPELKARVLGLLRRTQPLYLAVH